MVKATELFCLILVAQLIVLRLSRGAAGIITFVVIQLAASIVGWIFGLRANPRAALLAAIILLIPTFLAWFLAGVQWGYFDFP